MNSRAVYQRHCRALTVRQPWASLIGAGLKTRELRSWATSHRGPLWIHAGAHVTRGADELPHSAIVARVDLLDCVPEGSLWVWRLVRPRLLSAPLPARGAQGLWRLSWTQLETALARLAR